MEQKLYDYLKDNAPPTRIKCGRCGYEDLKEEIEKNHYLPKAVYHCVKTISGHHLYEFSENNTPPESRLVVVKPDYSAGNLGYGNSFKVRRCLACGIIDDDAVKPSCPKTPRAVNY